MSQNFTIDSGIAIPAKAAGGKRESKYPVAQMEVGQSFFIPKGTKSNQISVLKAFKAIDRKGITRVTKELVNGVETEGLRVWRVADEAPKAAQADAAASAE